MAMKKSIRAGDQNWCSKIANYLLDVFILIYSDMNRKCFKTFPLHPQNWVYEQKNASFSCIPQYLLSVSNNYYSNMQSEVCIMLEYEYRFLFLT